MSPAGLCRLNFRGMRCSHGRDRSTWHRAVAAKQAEQPLAPQATQTRISPASKSAVHKIAKRRSTEAVSLGIAAIRQNPNPSTSGGERNRCLNNGARLVKNRLLHTKPGRRHWSVYALCAARPECGHRQDSPYYRKPISDNSG
jgi:hypothetical protein